MPQSISPGNLSKGDSVAVVAPAGRVSQEQLIPAKRILKTWGVNPVEGNHLYNSYGYFAGKDKDRLSDLQEMLDRPDIKAIFCVRGGYGLTRIIDDVDFKKFKSLPKWVVGFSDITALHLKISALNIQSIHGIMPVHFQNEEKVASSLNSLKSILFGVETSISWKASAGNVAGTAQGYLRGGNLSILADSLGTSNALNGNDSILFFEEVDEYLYKIDRMLTQLKRADVLSNVKAVVVGHFTSVKDTKVPFGKELKELIAEKLDANIPLSFGLPAGHDFPNLSLPHNRWVTIDINNNETILQLKERHA